MSTISGSQPRTRSKTDILFAASFASFLSTLLTNPIYVAKLNIQFFPLSCPEYPHQDYRELMSCSCNRFSIVGAWSSLKVALPQVIISNGLYMQLYEQVRRWTLLNLDMTSYIATISASLVARFTVTSVNVPIEALRVRLSNTVQTEYNENLGNKLMKGLLSLSDNSIMSTIDKIRSNCYGYRITMLRDLTFSVLFWTALESYRNYRVENYYRLSARSHSLDEHLYSNFLPGMVFGGLVSAITTPLDLLKTRVQSRRASSYYIINELVEIYHREKIFGLFSGVGYRTAKNSLHVATYLLIYEWCVMRSTRDN